MATEGVNVPADALAAIAPYIAEPVKDLLVTGDDGVERLDWKQRISELRTEAGTAWVLELDTAGLAGTVWERNPRISTAWKAPADPRASGEKDALPELKVYAGTDSRLCAAFYAEFESVERIIEVIEKSAAVLAKNESKRASGLAESLSAKGQRHPCLLVAQQYRAPQVGIWSWVAVTGNNRIKAKRVMHGVDQASLITSTPTVVTEWLVDWAERNNAVIGVGADDEPAAQAVKVAVVRTQLVVGTDNPALLQHIVHSSNMADHLAPPLAFEANELNRGRGMAVIAAYVKASLIDPVPRQNGRIAIDLPVCVIDGEVPQAQ